jgi:TolB-like protein
MVKTVPGRGYCLAGPKAPAPQPAPAPEAAPPPEQGPPLLVVLPFANMTGGQSQDYLADGMTEGMIMALSQYRWCCPSTAGSA